MLISITVMMMMLMIILMTGLMAVLTGRGENIFITESTSNIFQFALQYITPHLGRCKVTSVVGSHAAKL